MNTRHLYTFQNGEVIVLEHISVISTSDDSEHKFFYVHLIGEVSVAVKDVEFEKAHSALQKYKTTERAELIKALAAI